MSELSERELLTEHEHLHGKYVTLLGEVVRLRTSNRDMGHSVKDYRRERDRLRGLLVSGLSSGKMSGDAFEAWRDEVRAELKK